MKKIKSRKKLALYGCSGLGVNMLNIIVGSYLCSALLTGGFEKHIESWTYLNKTLVVAGLWAVLRFIAKAFDGLIDLPLAAFAYKINNKFGRRKTAILIGLIPTVISYCLFLIPLDPHESLLNTIWFGALLIIFYACYTLTMLTYYATFSEICQNESDALFLSNSKSICDVVYFSLSFALVPVFVTSGVNIRIVALIFLPLVLTMLIPFFMLKENEGGVVVVKGGDDVGLAAAVVVADRLDLTCNGVVELRHIFAVYVDVKSVGTGHVLVIGLVAVGDKEPETGLVTSYLVYKAVCKRALEIADINDSVFLKLL